MDWLELFVSAGFWAAMLRIAAPLIFGTIGELICERAGVLNLGIEGIMTMGAMTGWMWVFRAVACGAALCLLHRSVQFSACCTPSLLSISACPNTFLASA